MSAIHQVSGAIAAAAGAAGDNPTEGWAYRKSITIDHTLVAGDILDFPVLISLATDADLAAEAQDDGDDILFTLDDGVTVLPYELESFDGGTGKLVAWVRVPLLSSSVDTVLRMYYGNPDATAQEDPDATWAGSYSLVLHLDESAGGGAPQFIDSTPVPDLASSFTFVSRWDVGGTGTEAQGVTTDGTHIWFTNSTTIYKYTKAGSLVTSRDVSGDDPTEKVQINGMQIKDGVLFVSAAAVDPYPDGTLTSWIIEYDPDTLAYITHHTLADAAFSEDLTFHDGYWWVVFHSSKWVSKYDTSWNLVDTYPLNFPITGSSGGYGAGQGYEGIAFQGDFAYMNIHEIYNENFVDVYHWNGVGFDPVYRYAHPTATASQGIAIDPVEANTIWFVEREYSGSSHIAKFTLTNAFAKSNGTANGGVASTTGKIEGGLDFDGSNDYVAGAASDRTKHVGPFTASCWMRVDAASAYSGVLTRVNGAVSQGWSLQNGSYTGSGTDRKVQAWARVGGSTQYANGTTALAVGTWYHVAFVYDGARLRVYVNGVYEPGDDYGSPVASGVVTPSTNPINLGRYVSSSTYYFNGAIDEARVAHTVRSANWLLTEYRNQNSPSTFYAVGSEEAA